eukprot:snap_masked-scaffold_11-processed-gene-11.3-mRNA-1 protein AED:1.00 eAED:1.00 QI:0/0/0/0/1/1/2/0/74
MNNLNLVIVDQDRNVNTAEALCSLEFQFRKKETPRVACLVSSDVFGIDRLETKNLKTVSFSISRHEILNIALII